LGRDHDRHRWHEDIVEVDDATWDAMNDGERERYKTGCYEDMLGNVVGGGCEEIEE
jgi:hypothetical protein